MKRRPLVVALVLSVLAGLGLVAINAPNAAAAGWDADDPIRAAFYTTTYPEQNSWQTKYTPKLGNYNQTNRTILAAHVAQAKYAGLDAFIPDWDQENSATDLRLPALLDVAASQDFFVAPRYLPESRTTAPSSTDLAHDLEALYSYAEDNPAWLRRGTDPDPLLRQPVLFIYNTGSQATCSEIDRLKAANDPNNNGGLFYLVVKVMTGYSTCSTQPHSWYQYAPSSAYSVHGTQSAVVSPGMFKYTSSTPELDRGTTDFVGNLEKQKATGARWQLTTSFNNWYDGTSVEPATEWDSGSFSGMGSYLDVMHDAYVTNPQPNPGPTTTAPPATGDIVLWAVGDNCDDQASSLSDTQRGCKLVGNMIKADNATSKVLALGDTQYESGQAANYTTYYDAAMGSQQIFTGSTESIKDRTIGTVGNHEYNTTNATGYYNYFGTAKSGDPLKGYFSVDVGTKWKILSVNTNCSKIGNGNTALDGCATTDPQGAWMISELDAATTAGKSTVVIMHHPPYTDGANYYPGVASGKTVWDIAYDHGADIVLTGHDHQYQRWGPINKTITDTSTQASAANAAGPHYFIVGTGGKGNSGFCNDPTSSPSAPCASGTSRTLYRWGDKGTNPGAVRLVLGTNGNGSGYFKTALDNTVRDTFNVDSR